LQGLDECLHTRILWEVYSNNLGLIPRDSSSIVLRGAPWVSLLYSRFRALSLAEIGWDIPQCTFLASFLWFQFKKWPFAL
jgi:hypothetical protein